MGDREGLRAISMGEEPLNFRARVDAAARGDAESLTWLYEAYVGMVHSYFRACHLTEADDLTSEVFLSMLRSLQTFRGDERAFRTWLMTIAHRRRVDYLRRNRPDRTSPSPPEVIELRAGIAPSAADRARLVDPRLPVGLRELTPDQREILAMRYVADMSLQEIAIATSRRVGAVKSMQKRALDALRRSVPDLRIKEATR